MLFALLAPSHPSSFPKKVPLIFLPKMTFPQGTSTLVLHSTQGRKWQINIGSLPRAAGPMNASLFTSMCSVLNSDQHTAETQQIPMEHITAQSEHGKGYKLPSALC